MALPDKPVPPTDYELPQMDFPLKSGLRVLVQEDKSAPVVVVAAMYAVGSTSDPKGREGLAHFVEHLAFRSRPGGGPELMHVIDRMGGFRNAFTTLDKTVYFTMAHKEHLNDLMQLEAWRLFKTVEGVTPEMFATEREVVRNELRLGNETRIEGKLFDTVLAQLFPAGHPFARPVIGSHDSLSAAKLEDAQTFIKANYTPDNCTIVISGDVDAQEVKTLLGLWPAELLYGPGGADGAAVAPRKRYGEQVVPEVPFPVNRKLVRDKGTTEQPVLVVAWSAPAAYRGNDALFDFVTDRLNLALGDVFAKTDLFDDDDIEGVSAFSNPLSEATTIYAVASLRPGADPERARVRILDTLSGAWTTNLGRLDVEVNRWFSATGLMLSLAQPFDKAVALVQHLGTTGHSTFFKDSLEGLAAVQNSQVMEFAAKWITRDRAVAVYFEPDSDHVATFAGAPGGASGATGATGAAGAAVGAAAARSAKARATEHQIGSDKALATLDLSADRIRQITKSPHLAGYPRLKLANGLQVIAAKIGSAPVVHMQLGLRGGNGTTRPYGLAGLASGSASSTCRDHGSLSAVGGWNGRATGTTRSTDVVSVLSGNVANGIAVLADSVSCLEVGEEGFQYLDRALTVSKKRFDRTAKQPEFVATKRLWSRLYPNHPYGEVATNPDALKVVTHDDAAAYVRSHFRPDNGVLVVSGDVDPDEVLALSQKYLTNWKSGGGGAGAVAPLPPAPGTREVFLFDRPKATQATIQIGCRLPPAKAEWIAAADVLTALGDDRAWKLREQLGATYGIYAKTTSRPGGAADLIFGGAVVTHLVGAVLDSLLGFVAEVESGKVDEDLFLNKRWDVARTFGRRFATGEEIAAGILEAMDHDWDVAVWDRYPENLALTTRQTLQQAIAGCSGHEIVTVVGDSAALRPQLEKMGLKVESNDRE